jgi:hypothetical protein
MVLLTYLRAKYVFVTKVGSRYFLLNATKEFLAYPGSRYSRRVHREGVRDAREGGAGEVRHDRIQPGADSTKHIFSNFTHICKIFSQICVNFIQISSKSIVSSLL